jgi:GTP cyclohydrolase I
MKHGHYKVGEIEFETPGTYALEAATMMLLAGVGEDPDREGLKETPRRFVEAMRFHCSGYGKDPTKILKTFEDGANDYDEMIVETGIPFYSLCEHHLAPFFGEIHVGYIPVKKVVGLSKIPRLIEVFARRLQVQERLTTQIAKTLFEGLGAMGVGVVVEARHFCMESRGVCKPNVITKTSCMLGAFRDKTTGARSEFLSLIKDSK